MPPLMRALDGIGSDVDHFECPRCGAHDRERHLLLYMRAAGLFERIYGARVLHFAPERRLWPKIAAATPAEYVRCDLHPATPDVAKVDIEAMPFADAAFDLVRPGVAMYGISPVPQLGGPADFGLRPVMTLEAELSLVKQVPGGHGVSYGHHYVTPGPTTLGLIPLGYADGIPRHASGTAPVLVAGKWRTVAGRVAMDQFVVDLGGDTPAPGDHAVLFGPGDRGEPTAEDWARAAGTIAYEIVTRIGSRVPRVYVDGGEAVPRALDGGSRPA